LIISMSDSNIPEENQNIPANVDAWTSHLTKYHNIC
jgi:hypothetical protein